MIINDCIKIRISFIFYHLANFQVIKTFLSIFWIWYSPLQKLPARKGRIAKNRFRAKIYLFFLSRFSKKMVSFGLGRYTVSHNYFPSPYSVDMLIDLVYEMWLFLAFWCRLSGRVSMNKINLLRCWFLWNNGLVKLLY